MKNSIKFIVALAAMLVVLSACSQHACPAYSDIQPVQQSTEQANS